jgi:hypothetical protein
MDDKEFLVNVHVSVADAGDDEITSSRRLYSQKAPPSMVDVARVLAKALKSVADALTPADIHLVTHAFQEELTSK